LKGGIRVECEERNDKESIPVKLKFFRGDVERRERGVREGKRA
jgi:hypothetical protein